MGIFVGILNNTLLISIIPKEGHHSRLLTVFVVQLGVAH